VGSYSVQGLLDLWILFVFFFPRYFPPGWFSCLAGCLPAVSRTISNTVEIGRDCFVFTGVVGIGAELYRSSSPSAS
jgi:hypothetical protein